MSLIWDIIYISGISITLFLLIMMISKPQKIMADKILSIWFFFALLDLGFIGFYASDRILQAPWLIGWELPLPFLHGPFLYLYILFLSQQQRMGKYYIVHFIPSVLVASVLAFILPRAIDENQIENPIKSTFEPLFHGIVVGIMVSASLYVVLSLILLIKHKHNIVGNFSNTDKITLNWMRYLIWGMGIIWIVVVFVQSSQLIYIAIELFIFFLGFFGIRQVGVFSDVRYGNNLVPSILIGFDETQNNINLIPMETRKLKYEKTRLEEAEMDRIHLELTQLMNDQKCYQNPDLTLGDLASLLTIPPSSLSQVINSKEQKINLRLRQFI